MVWYCLDCAGGSIKTYRNKNFLTTDENSARAAQ